MSHICHILEDTPWPSDTEIQVFVFDHRQISKRQTLGDLRVFETHFFVFDFRWFIKVVEKVRDIHVFDLYVVLIISWPRYNRPIWLIFSDTTFPTPAENVSSRFSAGQLKFNFLSGPRLCVGMGPRPRPYLSKHIGRLGLGLAARA